MMMSDGCVAVGWLPPGADISTNKHLFGQGLDYHFWIPNRLADKSQALVEVCNNSSSFPHLFPHALFFFFFFFFLFLGCQ
jgi:hypothetical protein